MTSYQLSTEEQVKYGCNVAVLLDYTDLNDTAGLTKTLQLYPKTGTIGVGYRVQRVLQKVITAFAGVTALVNTAGDANSAARYQASSDMKAAAGTWYGTQAAAVPYLMASGDNAVKLAFTATTDNLNLLTAGKLLVLLHVINLNDFPQAR